MNEQYEEFVEPFDNGYASPEVDVTYVAPKEKKSILIYLLYAVGGYYLLNLLGVFGKKKTRRTSRKRRTKKRY